MRLSSPLLASVSGTTSDFATFTVGGTLRDPTYNADVNADVLKGLKDISIEAIVEAARGAISQLKNSKGSFWDTPIPVVDTSLKDVVTFVDDVFTKLEEFVSGINAKAIQTVRKSVDSAIGSLDLAYATKQRLLDDLDDVIASLHADSTRTVTRLVASAHQLKKSVDALVRESVAGRVELLTALSELENLIPSLDNLEKRLENRVSKAINDALGIPNATTFSVEFVDYNSQTPLHEPAIVVGLTLDGRNAYHSKHARKLAPDGLASARTAAKRRPRTLRGREAESRVRRKTRRIRTVCDHHAA